MYYQLNEFFFVTRSDDTFQVLQEGKCSMSHPIHHKFLRKKIHASTHYSKSFINELFLNMYVLCMIIHTQVLGQRLLKTTHWYKILCVCMKVLIKIH